MSILIYLALVVLTSGQDQTTSSTCVQTTDSYFCRTEDDKSLKPASVKYPYATYGYCCKDTNSNAGLAGCTPDKKDLCTPTSALRKKEPSFQALYMSYSVGMTGGAEKVCGDSPIKIDATIASKSVSYKDKGVLAERKLKPSRIYESCHWIIKFPENTLYESKRTTIKLSFTEIKDADVYIFLGTRQKPTELIEDGGSAAVGDTITIPLGGQMVIVSQTKRGKLRSSLDFNFNIDVIYRPWWDTIGNTYFWLAVVGTILVLVSLLTGCYGGCFCCCCRPCKKKNLQGQVFNDPHLDIDPSHMTQNDEQIESDNGLFDGKPIGGRQDGDVHINDTLDEDMFNTQSVGGSGVQAQQSRRLKRKANQQIELGEITNAAKIQDNQSQIDHLKKSIGTHRAQDANEQAQQQRQQTVKPSRYGHPNELEVVGDPNRQYKQEHGMIQVKGPQDMGTSGGVDDDQPVKFYRFTKEQQARMRQEVYKNPYSVDL